MTSLPDLTEAGSLGRQTQWMSVYPSKKSLKPGIVPKDNKMDHPLRLRGNPQVQSCQSLQPP
jgi:hypothetical protein